MAKIRSIPDMWNLNVIQVDDEGNKCVGGKIITKDGEIVDYPVHKRFSDSISMVRDNIKQNGFVGALFSDEIDTGPGNKSPFSR